MMKKMPKQAVKTPTFDEYKTIKDEIIEISELRFENLLTNKLDQFRRDFKKELLDELHPRFKAMEMRFDAIDLRFAAIDLKFGNIESRFDDIDSKFDEIDSRFDKIDSRFDKIDSRFNSNDLQLGSINSRFEAIDSKIDTIKWSVWSMPLVMTVLMALFTLLLKYVII
jgi:chromosome segregation ATPase